MKKMLTILLSTTIICSVFIGCGFKPPLAKTGEVYECDDEKLMDSSIPTINIESVKKIDDNIVVTTDTEESKLEDAMANFIKFKFYTSSGDFTTDVKAKLSEKNGKGIFTLRAGDMNIKKIKYLMIAPYRNGANDIIFKVE